MMTSTKVTRTSFFLFILVACSAVNTAHAQRTGVMKDLIDDQTLPKTPSTTTIVPGQAFESPVDPESYRVGPSDIIAVNIWTSPPVSLVLTVTPEGSLIVPSVAEINVLDLTLAETKKRVIGEIKKKYLTGTPTVTLISPRKVLVTVRGSVQFPGTYTLSASDRVDRAIEAASIAPLNEIRAKSEEPQQLMADQKPSRRSIIVRHRDGTMERMDLTKYDVTKDGRWNEMLREGDDIFVPIVERSRNVFAIYGGVNAPGRFEFVEGDKATDAIKLAYGLSKTAKQDSGGLYRVNEMTGRLDEIRFNPKELLAGNAPDIQLVPGDRIRIREIVDRRQDFRVTVEGEVEFPGVYPITEDRTRLSTIIARAGGLTPFASIKSAEIIRTSVTSDQIQLDKLLSLRGGSVTPEDSTYYSLESALRIQHEIVNVDFEKLIVQHDTSNDIILRTDDRIVVPSVNRTIYVFGQVVSPGNVPYISGKDVDFYIQRAGGFTDRARTGDVMIIKRSSRQWLAPKETTIEEGDYVWVPKVIERSFGYYMGIIGQAASVVSVAVTVLLVVRTYR